MVRIAAHPQQWNEVHELLKKIDNDIMISKKILSDLEESEEAMSTSSPSPQTTEQPSTVTQVLESNTVGEVQRLIILLDNEEKKSRNTSNLRNVWPNLDESQTTSIDDTNKKKDTQNDKITTKDLYPWNKPQMKSNFSKDKEFTFHRVTGKPLHYRSNLDKTTVRNAYVAVSAIGPKNTDNILEDELRQLKPWNHQDNLNRMESLRKRWFLQPDRQK